MSSRGGHVRLCRRMRPVAAAFVIDAFARRIVGWRVSQTAHAGIVPSVGSVGDSYDNALAETVIGLFKTEMIRRLGPWRNIYAVEFTTEAPRACRKLLLLRGWSHEREEAEQELLPRGACARRADGGRAPGRVRVGVGGDRVYSVEDRLQRQRLSIVLTEIVRRRAARRPR